MEKNFIFALIFAAIIAIFALNNADKVMIDFIFTEVELSQALVIFLSSILGAAVMAILGSVKNYKLSKELKTISKDLESTKEEKINLEALLEDRIKEITQLKNQ